MADRAVITFSPFKFVGDDLFVFALLDDFRRHFCSVDRRAVRQLVAVGMHQNLGNHDLFAWLGLEQIDVNRVAFRDAILPATGLYDCKCHKGKRYYRRFRVVALRGKSRAQFHEYGMLASERSMFILATCAGPV